MNDDCRAASAFSCQDFNFACNCRKHAIHCLHDANYPIQAILPQLLALFELAQMRTGIITNALAIIDAHRSATVAHISQDHCNNASPFPISINQLYDLLGRFRHLHAGDIHSHNHASASSVHVACQPTNPPASAGWNGMALLIFNLVKIFRT